MYTDKSCNTQRQIVYTEGFGAAELTELEWCGFMFFFWKSGYLYKSLRNYKPFISLPPGFFFLTGNCLSCSVQIWFVKKPASSLYHATSNCSKCKYKRNYKIIVSYKHLKVSSSRRLKALFFFYFFGFHF